VRLTVGRLSRLRGGAKERENASRRQGRPAARKNEKDGGVEQGGRHDRGLRRAPTAPPWRTWPFRTSPWQNNGARGVLRRGKAHEGVCGASSEGKAAWASLVAAKQQL
jgi:hypothetical protein